MGFCGVLSRIRPSRLCRAFVPDAGVTGASALWAICVSLAALAVRK